MGAGRRVHTAKMDAAWSAYKSDRARLHADAVISRNKILRMMRMEKRTVTEPLDEGGRAELRAGIKRRVLEMESESKAMQREAVALYRQYGFFLPGPAKDFFRKLAIHLKWHDLEKVTK